MSKLQTFTSPIAFRPGDLVEHRKTGGLYKITLLPDRCVIGATGERAYAYMPLDTTMTFVRCQHEMEDGRFLLAQR